jgi:hypothetical protein
MIKHKVGYGNEGGTRNVSRKSEAAVAVNGDQNNQAEGTRSKMEAMMEISS